MNKTDNQSQLNRQIRRSINLLAEGTMKWFWQKNTRKSGELAVQEIDFIGEQDGDPEREFKEAVRQILKKREKVNSAYLAQATYNGDSEIHVGLFISADESEAIVLNKKIVGVFSSMFSSHEHLDIILINQEKETALQQICAPFYERSQANKASDQITSSGAAHD